MSIVAHQPRPHPDLPPRAGEGAFRFPPPTHGGGQGRRRCASFGCILALSLVQASHAAEWRIGPTVRISSTYTDNPRFLEEGASSAGGVGELSASLRRITERSEMKLQPRVRFSRHRDDALLDSDDQFLDATLMWLGERSHWDGSLNYVRDTTLTSELGSTGIVQSNRRHHGLTATLGPTWRATERVSVGGQAYWLDSSYEDKASTGLVDYEYRALSMFTAFAATPGSDWTLTAQGAELFVSEYGTRTRNATLRLMWTWRPLSSWTLKLSGGPAYVDAEAGTDAGEVFDLDLTRQAERWNTSLRAGRDLTPTGRGVLTRRDKITLGVSRRLTEDVSAGVSTQWVRNQDLQNQPGRTFYEVEYQRVDANVSWRMSEHWSLALGASAATQRYDVVDRDADNHQVTLGLAWNGQPHSL